MMVGRRPVGRGEAWVVTLPFSVDASDLTLRPGFLALLAGWSEDARAHAVPARSDVGTVWKFRGARDVQATGPAGDVAASRDDGVVTLTPALLGSYQVKVDGRTETRVASPDERELDLRPRAFEASAPGPSGGEKRAAVDASGEVALALLALMALEMAVRLWTRRPLAT
jgi:hypothetical protein